MIKCENCAYFEDEKVTKVVRKPNQINPHATEEIKIADGMCKRFPQWCPHNKEDDCGEWTAQDDNSRN